MSDENTAAVRENNARLLALLDALRENAIEFVAEIRLIYDDLLRHQPHRAKEMNVITEALAIADIDDDMLWFLVGRASARRSVFKDMIELLDNNRGQEFVDELESLLVALRNDVATRLQQNRES